ncbi:MAG: DUF4143 domain-containing protein, partial [Bacteroidetes bacterium]|nr:DUF4143 domain-containing protein [Bacteroidota bacterium]
QSSESLAGRIAYHTLNPFIYSEIDQLVDLNSYMVKGGYPRSALAKSSKSSENWKHNFVQSYVERDLFQWGGVSSTTMYRLWKMLAHLNGQVVNHSRLGNSLGVSSVTIRNYIDLLSNTFMVKQVPPYLPNIGKRLIKSAKLYLYDPGIICTLLEIASVEQLLGNPVFGSLWETVVLNQLYGSFPGISVYHYRTSQANELDFIIEMRGRRIAIECKASLSPNLTKGNYSSINDIKPDITYVVAPVNDSWPLSEKIMVIGILELIKELAAQA